MSTRSHSACKPVRDSVLGETLDGVADITRIGNLVRENSLDLLQADHTWLDERFQKIMLQAILWLANGESEVNTEQKVGLAFGK